jgi:hypothetical protein
MKLAWLMTYTLFACAHPVDPRDNNEGEDDSLAYITETIFVPYCATAECHSTFKQAGFPGDPPIELDTVEHAQTALQGSPTGYSPWLQCTGSDGQLHDPCLDDSPNGKYVEATFLISVLNTNDNGVRMPYDQPLPNKDVTYLEQWIIDGANGYEPAGSN